MVARSVALAVVIAASTATVTAHAQHASASRAVRAAVVVQQQSAYIASQPIGLQTVSLQPPVPMLDFSHTALVLAPPPPLSFLPPSKSVESSGCAPGVTQCGHGLLADLVITRDLAIPGAPGMAVRLIPTRSALAGGETSVVVFKPRVIGTIVGTSWYGLDVAARF